MIAVIIGAAIITYLTRVLGFYLRPNQLTPRFAHFLDDVPIAAFAALAAPGIFVGTGEIGPRLFAAIFGALAAYKFGKLWICIAVGLIAYWIGRLASGM